MAAHRSGLTREDLLGDLFYAGTLGYYAQLTTLASIMAQQNNTVEDTHNTLQHGTDDFLGLTKRARDHGSFAPMRLDPEG